MHKSTLIILISAIIVSSCGNISTKDSHRDGNAAQVKYPASMEYASLWYRLESRKRIAPIFFEKI